MSDAVIVLGDQLIAVKRIARSKCPVEWCVFSGEVRLENNPVERLAEIMKVHLFEFHKRTGFMKVKEAH